MPLLAALMLVASPARLDGSGFSVAVPEGFRNLASDPAAQKLIDGGAVVLYWEEQKTGGVGIIVTPVNDGTEKTADVATDKGCAALAKHFMADMKVSSAKRVTTLKYPACRIEVKNAVQRGIVVVYRLGPADLAVVTCKARASTTGPLRGCEEVVNGLQSAK